MKKITFEDSREVKEETGGFLLSLVVEQEKKRSWKKEEIDKIMSSIVKKLKTCGFAKARGIVPGYANTKNAKVFKSKQNQLKIAIALLKLDRGAYQLGFSTNFIQSRISYDKSISKKEGKSEISRLLKVYCDLSKLTNSELNKTERGWSY